MAVENQLWFIDIPLVADNPRDLAEIVIGFPFPAPALIIDYLRRYLNDVEEIVAVGPAVDLDTEVDGEFNNYMRRYLNDTINNEPIQEIGPEENLDIEVDGPDNKYLRRYLNDKD